jgi:enoyl-[acyl-carrier protein] reductase I
MQTLCGRLPNSKKKSVPCMVLSIAWHLPTRKTWGNLLSSAPATVFAQALDISAYSLIPVAREARKIMVEGGGIISLTYHGSVKVVQNYNLMGVAKAALESITRYLASELGPERIRVNAISAGPVKTASAQGVKDFSQILKTIEDKSPLRRNIDGVDVGKVGLFYLSELSSGITGEITYVDSGYNIMGL